MIPIVKKSICSCIMLSLITFGIYSIYWKYLLVRNTRYIKNDKSKCTEEVFCLIVVPFYSLYWWFTRGKLVRDEFSKHGYSANSNGMAFLVLALFGLEIIALAVMQNDFNSLPSESAQSNRRSTAKRMCVHKKSISDEEVQIIQILNGFSLLSCTLIQTIENNILTEHAGIHIARIHWDIVKMYHEIIEPFQRIQTDSFSPGIYCYMNSHRENNEKNYLLYILTEIRETIFFDYDGNGSCSDTKYCIYGIVEQTIKRLVSKGVEINQFCLLHGDLYNGNILMYQGKYALIDFEYVRFGPSQLEWAFFLFWDFITETDLNLRSQLSYKVQAELDILKEAKILNNADIALIIDVFLPALICLALHYCDTKKYVKNDVIRGGLLKFWENEYTVFKEKFNG